MNIFVLDDEKDIVELMTDILTLENHRARGFIKFDDMLNNFSDNIDLIISDINMPDISGFQVAEKISGKFRSNTPKILLMSAVSVNQSEYKAYKNIIPGIIKKPFNLKDFYDTINKIETSIKNQDLQMDDLFINKFSIQKQMLG